ncbi:MAG: DUF3943 domain-containing protein [Bacteroidetes bacterium]|nr:DUF3943 domain-containing protein [Bacteroidota bacterium]
MKHILAIIFLFISFITQSQANNNSNCDCEQDIYKRDYKLFDTCSAEKGLLLNTGIFVGGAVSVMGLLYLLPENVTSWDKKNLNTKNVFDKWLNNVKIGPKKDNDLLFWNYLAHPYWGGVFYMSARSLDYHPGYCFLYSAAMSTFLWEYGFEALAEVPSTQDLIITPVLGSVMGEAFYLAKRGIVKNNYRVLNSKFLGHFAAFLIDPANELVAIFTNKKDSSFTMNYYINPIGYTFSINYNFK